MCGVLGCTQSGPSSVDKPEPVTPEQPQVVPEAPADEGGPGEVDGNGDDNGGDNGDGSAEEAAAIIVHMTAATLADDCGGPPNTRPVAPAARADRGRREVKPGESKGDMPMRKAKAKRRCEQSSIQLAVAAPEGALAAKVAVKSVELLLESGDSLGMLEVRAPSVWSDEDGYTPWDQSIEPGEDLSVTYAVSQPDWSTVADRWNQTYTVKAVLSVAGGDQTVQREHVEVRAPTSLPPNVKT